MKNNLKRFAFSAIALAGFAFVSCDQDESLKRAGKPGLSTTESSISLVEGENPTITFVQDYPVLNVTNTNIGNTAGSEIRIEVIGGTAEQGVDYDFNIPSIADISFEFWGGEGYYLNLPGETTTNTINLNDILTVHQDWVPESTETIELRFHSAGLAQAEIYQDFTISIDNYVHPDPNALGLRLVWNGSFQSGGDTVDFCAVDMDLELYDAGFGFVDSSYYDCPEVIFMDDNTADGDYFFIPSMWTNSGYNEAINVPAILEISKPGVSYETVDLSSDYLLSDGGLDDGNGAAFSLFTINKTGSTYTVEDADMNVVFQGRMMDISSILMNKVK